MKYFLGVNGKEYLTKEDADNPCMGQGCVGVRDTDPGLRYQPVSHVTSNPIAGSEVKLVSDTVAATNFSNLEGKTLLELQEIAKAKGIKGYQLFKENTLINKIKEIN